MHVVHNSAESNHHFRVELHVNNVDFVDKCFSRCVLLIMSELTSYPAGVKIQNVI